MVYNKIPYHMDKLTYYIKKHIEWIVAQNTILDNICIDAIFYDIGSSTNSLELLCRPIPGIKKFGFRVDIPFGEQRPGNQKHMHIYIKEKEIFAINADGTSHDGYHGVQIPTKIIPFLKSKGITIPKNLSFASEF